MLAPYVPCIRTVCKYSMYVVYLSTLILYLYFAQHFRKQSKVPIYCIVVQGYHYSGSKFCIKKPNVNHLFPLSLDEIASSVVEDPSIHPDPPHMRKVMKMRTPLKTTGVDRKLPQLLLKGGEAREL